MRRFRGQNRRTKRPHNGIRLPRNAPEIELEIERTGARGDGIGTARYTLNYETRDWPVFVAGTLAGERVRVRPTAATAQGITAEIIELIRPSPDRAEPVCNVFRGGQGCGGCAFQHMSEAAYRRTKTDAFTGLLDKAGLSPDILPPVWTEMAGRRRAKLAYRRTTDSFITGFAGRASQFIYPLESCGILSPALKEVTDALAGWAAPCFMQGETGTIQINMLSSGADLLIRPDQDIPADRLTGLSEQAAALAAGRAGLVRLAVQPPGAAAPVLLLARADAAVHLDRSVGGQALSPPPGAFLQASAQAETALVAAVLAAAEMTDGVGPHIRPQIVDLYCGVGTFSLPLLGRGAGLRGYEADKAAVEALLAAARTAGFGSRTDAFARDLTAAPVRAEELADADIILADPPRQGAAAQMAELARLGQMSKAPPKVIMVSCNPFTALRDIDVLIRAGWQLETVQMVDQFVRTAHIEMVAVLRHPGQQTKSGQRITDKKRG